MDESRIPLQLFYGELTEGKLNPWCPKKRYKDNLKANLKWAGIEPMELETTASNRSGWHATTMSTTRNFEDNRHLCITAAKDRQKRAANNPITTGGTHAQFAIAYAPQSLVFIATCMHTADTYHQFITKITADGSKPSIHFVLC